MSNPAYDKAHSKSIVLAKRRILIEHNLPSVRKQQSYRQGKQSEEKSQ